jgi:hypothetical protein
MMMAVVMMTPSAVAGPPAMTMPMAPDAAAMAMSPAAHVGLLGLTAVTRNGGLRIHAADWCGLCNRRHAEQCNRTSHCHQEFLHESLLSSSLFSRPNFSPRCKAQRKPSGLDNK